MMICKLSRNSDGVTIPLCSFQVYCARSFHYILYIIQAILSCLSSDM